MTAEKKPTVDAKLLAQAQRLASLVDYQEGSIVSRSVIDQPTGTVTLFAFDRGQKLSEHTAPFHALVCVIDGRVKISINGKPNELAAGDAIIMPANQPHAVEAMDRFKMMLIMIRA